MPLIRITITGVDGASRTVETEQDSFILGSGAGAGIKLEDAAVSSVHAMIKVDSQGSLSVTDLGSEKGTQLDGRVIQNAQLQTGQTLLLGQTRVVLSVLGAQRENADLARNGRTNGEGRPMTLVDGNTARVVKADPARRMPLRDARAQQLDRRLAERFLRDELPPELKPTKNDRDLQVALVWGGDTFVEVGDFHRGEPVRVGTSENVDLHLFSSKLPSEDYQLFAPAGEEVAVAVPEGAGLTVSRSGQSITLEQLVAKGAASTVQAPFRGHSYQLDLEDRVTVDLGGMTVIARWVRTSPAKSPTLVEQIDFNFAKWVAIAMLVLIAFLGIVHITPLDLEELTGDLFKNKNTIAKFVMAVPEPPKKFKELSGVKEGAKAKGDEGKFGKKDAKQKEAAPSKKGAPIVDKNKREEDRAKIQKSGLLAALGKLGGEGAVSNVLGPGGLGTGINNALGGLKGGAGMGDANGVGGLGSRGTGSGGGGTALGIGGLGTKGNGHGKGGYGSLDLGGRGKDDVGVVVDKITMSDGLSREVIGRIIQRHWNEIKYCYESELTKDPNLYGKVAVLFIIGGDGSVADAQIQQSTMGNANVETCMTNHIKRWKFPEPKGGGTVNVTYPWVFKPAGG